MVTRFRGKEEIPFVYWERLYQLYEGFVPMIAEWRQQHNRRLDKLFRELADITNEQDDDRKKAEVKALFDRALAGKDREIEKVKAKWEEGEGDRRALQAMNEELRRYIQDQDSRMQELWAGAGATSMSKAWGKRPMVSDRRT